MPATRLSPPSRASSPEKRRETERYRFAPGGDAWALAHRLAAEGGAIVAPGELYGEAGADHVRIAVVQPDEQIALVAQRLGAGA